MSLATDLFQGPERVSRLEQEYERTRAQLRALIDVLVEKGVLSHDEAVQVRSAGQSPDRTATR